MKRELLEKYFDEFYSLNTSDLLTEAYTIWDKETVEIFLEDIAKRYEFDPIVTDNGELDYAGGARLMIFGNALKPKDAQLVHEDLAEMMAKQMVDELIGGN